MWIIAVCETPLFSSLEPRQANHSFDEVVNPEIGRDSHRQRYAYRHHATSADTLCLSIMYSMFSYLHRGLFLNHVVPTSGLPQRVVFLMSEPERADFDIETSCEGPDPSSVASESRASSHSGP